MVGAAVVAIALVVAFVSPGDLRLPAAERVAKANRPRPNVVLIVTDDQRADSLAGMPKLNRLLVAKGVRFSNAMVPTSLCCPSRATILTGLYAHDTRVFGNGDIGGDRFGGWAQFRRRGMEYRTLATALTERGYRTGFFGKYLNDFSKQSPDGYRPPGWDRFTAFKYSRGAYFHYRLTDGTRGGRSPRDYSTDLLARKANTFVRNTADNRPVFLMYAPYGPHSPYTPAPRDARRAGPLPVTLPPGVVSAPTPDQAAALPRWRRVRQRSPAEWAAVRAGQAATLLAVDDAVASIVRTMRRAGRVRDTLFVFLSDNAYLVGEQGMIGKDNPYDGAARVPLVVRWDGRAPRGVVDSRLALNVDVAGTIARAAGASMRTAGLNLLGSRTRDGFPIEAMPGYRGRPAYCGWRTKRWLYVRYATGRSELYDYVSDPYEQRNLAGQPAVAAVQSRLRALAVRNCSPTPPGFTW